MEQERDTQIIFFKDLFFCIVRKWKPIILFALIGALLLGGNQVLNNREAIAAQNAALSGDELSQREQVRQAIADTNARIETQRNYLANAPLMLIDPNQAYQAKLVVYVHSNYKIQPNMTYQNPDSRPAILAAYQQVLTSGEVINHLAEETGLPSQHLHELFAFQQVVSHPAILSVTISASTEEAAQLLLDLSNQAVLNAATEVASQTDKHTIRTQTAAPILRSDKTIAESQKLALQRLTTLQEQKAEWQKLQTSITITGDEASPVIQAILGAAIGAVLVCVLVCLHHIGSPKVYSERTLKNRTGLRILGRTPSTDRHSKAGRWLQSLEGRVVKPALGVIGASIRNTANAENILLLGAAPESDREALCQALSEAKITFTDGGNLLTDPTAHDALAACGCVILVEKCNHSTYPDIEHVMEAIEAQGKPILGCILLDG